jgi:hypothetical protein
MQKRKRVVEAASTMTIASGGPVSLHSLRIIDIRQAWNNQRVAACDTPHSLKMGNIVACGISPDIWAVCHSVGANRFFCQALTELLQG